MVKQYNAKYRVGQGGLVEVSSDVTLEEGVDQLVLVDATGGPVDVTLPRADGSGGKRYCIKKIDSSANAVTISTSLSQTIDGSATATLTTQDQTLDLISDNENWLKVVLTILNPSVIGPHDTYFDAGHFKSKTTLGVASGQLDSRELPVNDNDIDFFEFTQAGGTQRIMGQLVFPRTFDNQNISASIYWTAPAGAGDVAWKIQLLPRSNGDALDAPLLAEVEIVDTFLVADQVHITTFTPLTLSGAIDADFYLLQVGRVPGVGNDDFTGDAQFLGMLAAIVTDAATS